MAEKPIDWRGSSLRDIKNDAIFTSNARREAGQEIATTRYKAVIRERSKK